MDGDGATRRCSDGGWASLGFWPGPTSLPDLHAVPGAAIVGGELTLLDLGKRKSGEWAAAPAKRERMAAAWCQVEGCDRALAGAKTYHRRHKVCEEHSKASRVVVFGSDQRFCQQCSRFHAISEFDDSKRSCRRRLAGHNERRRKGGGSSAVAPAAHRHDGAVAGNLTLPPPGNNRATSSRNPSTTTTHARAPSLLSSKPSPWISEADISSRSRAALRELIAENRAAAAAAALAQQLLSDNSRGAAPRQHGDAVQAMAYHSPWHRQAAAAASHLPAQYFLNGAGAGSQVTLDLMQKPTVCDPTEPLVGLSIVKGTESVPPREEEEECSAIWKSLEGTHVV